MNLPAQIVDSGADSRSVPLQGQLINLGLGGGCLVLAEQPSLGAKFTLSVLAPNLWDPLEIEARVVWSDERHNGTYVGLAFTNTQPVAFKALLELIRTEAYE